MALQIDIIGDDHIGLHKIRNILHIQPLHAHTTCIIYISLHKKVTFDNGDVKFLYSGNRDSTVVSYYVHPLSFNYLIKTMTILL